MTNRSLTTAQASPGVLHFAFEYLDRGWPVIPIDGKIPATPWTAYQKKAPSTELVRHWFGPAAQQHYNLAIVTGRYSGLVVVDFDSLEDARWWQNQFPATPLTVYTGRGMHFYYRYPDEHIACRTHVMGRQIDIRGEGGLAIAPPSIHPETGHVYHWHDTTHYALYDVPLFQSRWVTEPNQTQFATLSRPEASCRVPSIRDGIAYIRRIQAVAGNGGHNATFRAACKLRDSGMTAAEALEALSQWNETNASPPWTAKELAHKVEDAYRNV